MFEKAQIVIPSQIPIMFSGLSRDSVLTEDDIARRYDRCVETVKRAIERKELPHPIPLFGGNIWTFGFIVDYMVSQLAEKNRLYSKHKA